MRRPSIRLQLRHRCPELTAEQVPHGNLPHNMPASVQVVHGRDSPRYEEELKWVATEPTDDNRLAVGYRHQVSSKPLRPTMDTPASTVNHENSREIKINDCCKDRKTDSSEPKCHTHIHNNLVDYEPWPQTVGNSTESSDPASASPRATSSSSLRQPVVAVRPPSLHSRSRVTKELSRVG